MATFLPHAQIPPQPVQDPTPGTPPDQALFYANNIPQRIQASTVMNGSRTQNRTSGEYRGNGASGFGNGNGAVAMPAGPHAHMGNGGPRNMVGMGGPAMFDGPRSPPNTKSTISPANCGISLRRALTHPNLDTSHVPCKFFRAGGCQAGKACPFSHSTDLSTVDTPCKYFSKVRLFYTWHCPASRRQNLHPQSNNC